MNKEIHTPEAHGASIDREVYRQMDRLRKFSDAMDTEIEESKRKQREEELKGTTGEDARPNTID